ncbi:Radical SAM family enzyme, similar to coproporphyrinogen III oxidase, oxygen-independent, clustered with nucleoside-triphosphatase RdgB [hydrothermal vent metagenome]|uniref:Radical SAM family enzyme, similar to coproporphyrinogen III oxidase, oxygen-independent, clustered with nucleoside-triphosphatase RdgB n=1 Tax=hydrothermal vent metagenome TaxID=652676 RepID=A0A3B0W6G9_9ZZZZ
MNFTQPIPLTLYVHYPWCVQKCPYCDFNSHNLKPDVDESAYIDALIRQLEQTLPLIWGRSIHAIFFGGGTPSLISEEGLNRFMSHARALLGFDPSIEVTLEANPGTVDFEKFAGFYQAGINRLSMGIQSFEDQKLSALGRIHSGEEAFLAIEAAKQVGFTNFNLDLMFALPNQTVEQALADVEQALFFSPPHLSHYQLTLEPNTPFYKNPPPLPEDDLAWEMQLACQARIAQAGYEHYEVSGFAKKNRLCQHNVNYWQFGDYIGLGAGAHGKITMPPEGKIWRTQMPASPGGYIAEMQRTQPGRQVLVSEHDACFEFMLNALRLQDGFDLALFEQRTGLPLSNIEEGLNIMQQKGWRMVSEPQYLKLTTKGKHYLNDVVSVFLP